MAKIVFSISANTEARGFADLGETENTEATDKEITVKIRSNSHYRNSAYLAVKSECLSARADERLLGKEERGQWKMRRGRTARFRLVALREGRFYFILLKYKKPKG